MSIFRRIVVDGAVRWRRVSLASRRRAVVVAVMAPMALAALLDAGRTSRRWSVLYTGLSARESVAVRRALKRRRVPFELDDGGRTVLAPTNQCAELRVELDTWVRSPERGRSLGKDLTGEGESRASERGKLSGGPPDGVGRAQEGEYSGSASAT